MPAAGRAGRPRARSRRPRGRACPLSVRGGGRGHGTALQSREGEVARLGRSQGTLRWSPGVLPGDEHIPGGSLRSPGKNRGAWGWHGWSEPAWSVPAAPRGRGWYSEAALAPEVPHRQDRLTEEEGVQLLGRGRLRGRARGSRASPPGGGAQSKQRGGTWVTPRSPLFWATSHICT